mmetsp:Transcript_8137/g.23109  ORF Transcript_8137/g.23109 Transcript_8137/m.23109 type:complete len:143 (-) Transcript_8137:105-533(-)
MKAAKKSLARKMCVPSQARRTLLPYVSPTPHTHTRCTSIHPQGRPGRQADRQADIAKTGQQWVRLGLVRAFLSLSHLVYTCSFVGSFSLTGRSAAVEAANTGWLCVPLNVPSAHITSRRAGRQADRHTVRGRETARRNINAG